VISRATKIATGAAETIFRGGRDSGAVAQHIRGLFKRASGEKVTLDLNKVIGDVFRLLRGGAARMRIVSAMEAMNSVIYRPKRLFVRSVRRSVEAVVVEIRDHGVGMGMGLAICRSIIDALDGPLWAPLQAGTVQ
jgi:C4-dicarboxylate-specific signal transduction histidine kinase